MKKLLASAFAMALLGSVVVAHAEKGENEGSDGKGGASQALPAPDFGWLSLSALLIAVGAAQWAVRRRSRG